MKTPTLVGICLIVIGLIVLSVGGFSFTHREKVIDLGPLQVAADKTETFPLPPLLGYACLAGGVFLVAAGALGKKG